MSGKHDDFDSVVRSKFTVRDVFQLSEGEAEYRVDYGPGAASNFSDLLRAVAPLGMTARLVGSSDGATLFVKKKQPMPDTRSRVPVILALLTMTSTVVFAIFERTIFEEFAPGFQGEAVLVIYAAAIILLLLFHEVGHRYTAGRLNASSPTPYFIPGIPGLTSFLPALGIAARQREPSTNRDLLFDVMIVGPLLAFLLAIILYVIGGFFSVQSSTPLQGHQLVNPFISVSEINPSVIQAGLDYLIGPLIPNVAPGFVRLSPLQDAATVGFLLTVVGLLPLASFDGGHLSSLSWGTKGSRVATYASVFALIALDTPNYWALAIVVLLVAGRPAEPQLLDEVSPLSKSRGWIYLVGLFVALLSLPIPQNVATFPLG